MQGGIASGRNGSKAIQVVNQRNPCDKSKNREDKGEQLFGCKDTTYVGTWNIRTLYSAGQLDVLLHQLRGVRWSIMGLSEVRWTGSGELDRDDYNIIYSGRPDNKQQDGVALISKKEAARAMIGYAALGPRIIKTRFRTPKGKATVIQVYAPTSNSTEEEIEDFYTALQEAMGNTPSQDLIIVMGDFNAKVGKDWETWRGAMGRFGYGEENQRGGRLLSFCLGNSLKIMNTQFYQRKANRKWTWESPDGKTRNMIDFVLVNNGWKSSVTMCRTFTKLDVASDHNLVMAGIRVKLKTIHREKSGKKFDIERLDDNLVRREYSTLLKSKWEHTKKKKNRDSVEVTWEDIRSIYTEVAQQVLGTKKGKKQKPWISQEVLRMSDQRRAMKATTHIAKKTGKGITN